MGKATVCGLAGAALLAVVSVNTNAMAAFHGLSSLNAPPPARVENEGHTKIAETKNDSQDTKQQKNKCKRLLSVCQYASNPGQARTVCTPENLKYMKENCMGKK